MENKSKKLKSKNSEDQITTDSASNFAANKSMKFQVGEYVWCTNTGSPYMLGKMAFASDDVPDSIKRSRRSNTILIQLLHDLTYQNIPVPSILPFKESFLEHSDAYTKKVPQGLSILEKTVKEIRWGEGKRILEGLLNKQLASLPMKRSRLNYPCEICGKSSGPQVFCFECGKSSVHKKKCAGITSDEWTCKRCIKQETVGSSPVMPELSRNSSVVYEPNVQNSIDRVVEEAKKDKDLLSNLLRRQQKYAEINAELIRRSESLITIQKPEEIRRKRYENDEYIRKETDDLISDLISQLHCAKIPGFEGTKKLIEIYGNDIQTLDRYRASQKEIVLGLLKYKLPSNENRVYQDLSTNKFERFLDRSNPDGLHSKLANTMKRFSDMTVQELNFSPSAKVVYSLTKLVIDATLANCEYTPGQQIDHIGGGTNPENLKALFRKIKDK